MYMRKDTASNIDTTIFNTQSPVMPVIHSAMEGTFEEFHVLGKSTVLRKYHNQLGDVLPIANQVRFYYLSFNLNIYQQLSATFLSPNLS